MRTIPRFVFVFSLLAAGRIAMGDVALNHLFSDHMVLQQGAKVPVWGTADAGEKVSVTFEGQTQTTTAGADGKWLVDLSDLKTGPAAEMDVAGKNSIAIKDVLVGEVWLCSGQSNMFMPVAAKGIYRGAVNYQAEVATANFPNLRVFTVDTKLADAPRDDSLGKWEVASPGTAGGFSATAYFFGRDLQTALGIPVGIIHSSFGGSKAEAWIDHPTLAADPTFAKLLADYDAACAAWTPAMDKADADALTNWRAAAAAASAAGKPAPRRPRSKNPHKWQQNPALLFNGMIEPILGYGIRGVAWYQGESNADHPENFSHILATLIADWRQRWGEGEFPFLIVQLPNYGVPSTQSEADHWAMVRDQQTATLDVPNTAMTVTIDIGETGNIHPRNKQEVGRRLSLLAEDVVYHRAVVSSGPVFDSFAVDGDAIRVRFKNIMGGLKFKGDKLEGFAIAGADGKWSPAEAKIDGDCVIVSSSDVKNPTQVRYAWADDPVATLYNSADLPARPFGAEH